ncbi:MAG TPA: response regulator transcription factor [Bryobacteraceae bacterium]|nr:response regulator transcription factor [Bryobacteraceae bacterium]
MRYRLVLADDHKDILDEVRRLLQDDFEIVGAVTDGAALIEAVAALRPDAVVTDIYMPGLDGIEAGAEILRRGLCNAVIVLTMHNDPQMVRKVLLQGIQGYVLKDDATEDLLPAVHAVLGGGRYLSQGVVDKGPK